MKKKTYIKKIRRHYRSQAEASGLSLNSTMADSTTRELELKVLAANLKSGARCLEIGCGNGWASVELSRRLKLNLLSLDFSPEMIKLARRQSLTGVKGKISFEAGDVLKLDFAGRFDAVFTVRCIINLLSWADQRLALKNLARAVKRGGRLILIEAFADGLEELNQARREVGLPPIPPAYHNRHLEKDKVTAYLAGQGLKLEKEDAFLSSYYFGSRVLYPALAKANGVAPVYNSAFVKMFADLPPRGNYAHIKLMSFKKI